MNSQDITALGAMIVGLLGAGAAAYAAVVRARRDQVVVDRQELRDLRTAWAWALRIISLMRSFIARKGLEEPEEWNIDSKIEEHERRLAGE